MKRGANILVVHLCKYTKTSNTFEQLSVMSSVHETL